MDVDEYSLEFLGEYEGPWRLSLKQAPFSIGYKYTRVFVWRWHSRYVTTVIARIYYDINATWSSKLYADEVRRSNLMQTIRLLELEDDINKVCLQYTYFNVY